jgi:hypothetical protein
LCRPRETSAEVKSIDAESFVDSRRLVTRWNRISAVASVGPVMPCLGPPDCCCLFC